MLLLNGSRKAGVTQLNAIINCVTWCGNCQLTVDRRQK